MARMLITESEAKPFRGSILQLGRQSILFSRSDLREWMTKERKSREGHSIAAMRLDGENHNGKRYRQMGDEEFFEALGFDAVFSCDASDYEEATVKVNLNVPVPSSLHIKFDAIYDGGTMEHIFNVPEVLRNIHEMLIVGGRVIHVVPSSNMVDHGFYSFSPTFFRDYYETNGYKLRTLYLFECLSWGGIWKIYNCLSGVLDNRLGRISTAKMSGVFCVAEKQADSTTGIFPVQRQFAALWELPSASRKSGFMKTSHITIFRHFPAFGEFLIRMRALFWKIPVARRFALPPLVGKY